jgi:hypothetical protein
MNYGHQSLIGTEYVLHYKFNGIFSTPDFEKPEELHTDILVDGMGTGIIMKVPTIFDLCVERFGSMDDSEFKEVAYCGIFKAMKKHSESFMEHTQASKLIMEKNAENMIDSEEDQLYFIGNHDKMWEELKALQCGRINVQFPFIEEVVQVVVEVRSIFYLYF